MPELPTGDELNLFLHKHIFNEEPDGFTEDGFPYRIQTIYDGDTPFEAKVLMGTLLTGDGMLAVVAEMQKQGYAYHLHYYPEWMIPESTRIWAAKFFPDDEFSLQPWLQADDAPTATAYAALYAKGVIE